MASPHFAMARACSPKTSGATPHAGNLTPPGGCRCRETQRSVDVEIALSAAHWWEPIRGELVPARLVPYGIKRQRYFRRVVTQAGDILETASVGSMDPISCTISSLAMGAA